MNIRFFLRSLFVAVLVIMSSCAEQDGTSTENFYEGKTVFVYVGRPPGTGADLVVRSFVRYWKKHIPGQPTMVVKNVPGGGGFRVWNLAWDQKKSDALEIFFSPVSGMAVIVRQKGLRADLTKMPMVGGLMSPNIMFARTDRVRSADDLVKMKNLRFGGHAPAHRFNILGRLALDMLGVEYLSVAGFSGATDVFNAMRRKEVDIQMSPLNFYRFTVEPSVVESGEVIPLWYNPVISQNGEIEPLEAAGDIPSFIDYYRSVRGEPPTGELYEVYKWLLPNVNGIVHGAFMPPDTPKEALRILRDSFASVTRDKMYRAEEVKMFGFNLPVVSSAEGTTIIDNMTHAPEQVRQFLYQYVQDGR